MGKRQTNKLIKINNANSEAIASSIQYLMPDVAPITLNDRMVQKCAAPMVADCMQSPCDMGLFDSVQRNQIDLLDYLRAAPQSLTILSTTQLDPTKTQQE